MICNTILFSDHAVSQMFRRDISVNDVKLIVESGEIISVYLHDKPFPSYLMLGFILNRPLHVVLAKDETEGSCIVITTYEPDSAIWEFDFKAKKK